MPAENKNEILASQLNINNEILSAITDMMPDRHFILNEEGIILKRYGNIKNEQFYDLASYQPRTLAELTTPKNAQKALLAIKKSIKTQQEVTFEVSIELDELQLIMPNIAGPTTKQWFEIRVMPLSFLLENKKTFISSIRNITERKLAEIKLHELSVTDSLTHLYNRRYATEELSRCFQRLQRYKTPITVLMLDIDFFKTINDSYGHDIGDLVLLELSKFLKDNVRGLDTVARIGGEEFLIIMPDVTINDVQPFCERLLMDIEKLQIPVPDGSLTMTVSGGLSQFKASDKSIEALLKRVDNALYESKHNGKNKITIAE